MAKAAEPLFQGIGLEKCLTDRSIIQSQNTPVKCHYQVLGPVMATAEKPKFTKKLFLQFTGCGVRFKTYQSQQQWRSKVGWTSLKGGACRKLLEKMGEAISSSSQIFDPRHIQLLSEIWIITAR